MLKKRKYIKLLAIVLSIAILIIDGRTAIDGAKLGIDICLYTVLPSLFPFIFLTPLLTESLLSTGQKTKFLCHLYKIPQGSDGLLMAGLLGGYPVGAKCIEDAVINKLLSPKTGESMLIFCNAAGPTFIFGMIGSLFNLWYIPWILWVIHILSGIAIANLLPSYSEKMHTPKTTIHFSFGQRMRESVLVMGDICGWIVLMRTWINILQKYCLEKFPSVFRLIVTGIIELSNGCISLSYIENSGLRFVLCSVFLGFGGLCVVLQTASAAPSVDQKRYIPRKCLQALISFTFAYPIQLLLFTNTDSLQIIGLYPAILALLSGIIIYSKRKAKNKSGILESIDV